MSRSYFWGVPVEKTDLDAYWTAVNQRRTDEGDGADGKNVAPARVEHALGRVTDKSAALLQADSILAALSTFFAYQIQHGQEWIAVVNKVALALALLSCLIVLFNLGLAWAKNVSEYETAEKHFAFTFSVLKGRAIRFTLALYLSTLAFAMAFVAAVAAAF